MKPALEKFLLVAATLAAIGIFIFVSMWASIKGKKEQMDQLFNSTNVPTSYQQNDSLPGWESEARYGLKEMQGNAASIGSSSLEQAPAVQAPNFING